ncbi:hypothetical protein [Paraburkholderia sp. RAU2J]|uniref:hypothetical protein n=1 Tax=Paraburkholderia sp. RAU2J TaxID=1938810 RepID=UPI000EB4E505|nr:hypothetical protein [Paraburkholderia sp. RAU2J]
MAKKIEARSGLNALVAALAGALREAAVSGKACFCQEAAAGAHGGLRAVIQFQARRALFNQFFDCCTSRRIHVSVRIRRFVSRRAFGHHIRH